MGALGGMQNLSNHRQILLADFNLYITIKEIA
jgi:hypothetical protein